MNKTPNLKLKALRVEHGLTQEEMANKLGISEGTYNQKENGLREFNLKEAKLIAKLFSLPLDDIFFADKVSKRITNNKLA